MEMTVFPKRQYRNEGIHSSIVLLDRDSVFVNYQSVWRSRIIAQTEMQPSRMIGSEMKLELNFA